MDRNLGLLFLGEFIAGSIPESSFYGLTFVAGLDESPFTFMFRAL
jgi:hypothetical protein